MTDEEIMPPAEDRRRRSRAELDAMVEDLWDRTQVQQAQIDRLRRQIAALEDEQEDNPRWARWLPYSAPPAAEDNGRHGETPLVTIACFVQYYNETYVGQPGSRAVAIPDCWLEHPGLVAELATLTYTWRAAHVGKGASVRDAQYWHDRWRPAFAERLVTEWVHAHCLADGHKAVGALGRRSRFEPAPEVTDS
ncbi:hypothetical protein FPZ12_007975 [Amycolatopsis acidicola]|uniref:DUF4913 domain-containing protein n=1 Tax=Amycolatopsis acidicola TaxID=2596893 RepID=A0A5N0VGK6_9PSEU|nr:hypothetical protein [Amycolatopsis acidicola]KAA9163961.1 hypothetical protein FPZ12_007975 [Amycolatopsis acidicola]